MSSDTLGGQWSEVGPAKARERNKDLEGGGLRRKNDWAKDTAHDRMSYGKPQVQGQLRVGKALTAQVPAHHQTPEQFAADPSTWWHGRFAKSPKLTKGGSDEGFHAGTQASASQRLRNNYGRRSGDAPARMFSLRLTGEMKDAPISPGATRSGRSMGTPHWYGGTPENPMPDRDKHSGLQHRSAGYFYKNAAEDVGHISVGVPHREGFLSTHKDMVAAAQQRGDYVHPNIAWAAKKAPEHTGEDVMAYKRTTIHNDYLDGPPAQGSLDLKGGAEQKMDRTSFETASGRMQHVFRDRRGRDSNEPKSWST